MSVLQGLRIANTEQEKFPNYSPSQIYKYHNH